MVSAPHLAVCKKRHADKGCVPYRLLVPRTAAVLLMTANQSSTTERERVDNPAVLSWLLCCNAAMTACSGVRLMRIVYITAPCQRRADISQLQPLISDTAAHNRKGCHTPLSKRTQSGRERIGAASPQMPQPAHEQYPPCRLLHQFCLWRSETSALVLFMRAPDLPISYQSTPGRAGQIAGVAALGRAAVHRISASATLRACSQAPQPIKSGTPQSAPLATLASLQHLAGPSGLLA